jgi:hypothetical protein
MAGEVQELIDAQIGADGVGGRVLLPRKVFQVHETIRIAGVRGLKITGQAPAATDLRWFGPSDVPMFDIDRCQDIVVEDLSITVGADAMLIAAAWIQQGYGPVGQNGNPKLESSHVAWQNIVVRGQGNLERAFYVKLNETSGDVKNDHHSFSQVRVSGYSRAAFTLEGRNAKDLSFDRCHCLGLQNEAQTGEFAIDTSTHPNAGGAFLWRSGATVGHKLADFKIGDRNDTIKIDGVYSENSARMLQMPNYGPGAGVACPVLIENYRFAGQDAAPDGEVVQCEAAGPLSMVACKIGGKGQQMRIRYDPQPAPGAFNFIGNAIADDGEGPVFTACTPTMPYELGNLAYREGRWQPLGRACR